MTHSERTEELRSSLAADGYQMDIAEAGGRVSVTIRATAEARGDCLVPKDLMRGILGQALGVAQDTIDLSYPRQAGGTDPGGTESGSTGAGGAGGGADG